MSSWFWCHYALHHQICCFPFYHFVHITCLTICLLPSLCQECLGTLSRLPYPQRTNTYRACRRPTMSRLLKNDIYLSFWFKPPRHSISWKRLLLGHGPERILCVVCQFSLFQQLPLGKERATSLVCTRLTVCSLNDYRSLLQVQKLTYKASSIILPSYRQDVLEGG